MAMLLFHKFCFSLKLSIVYTSIFLLCKEQEKDLRKKLYLISIGVFASTHHIGDWVGELCWHKLEPWVLAELSSHRVLKGERNKCKAVCYTGQHRSAAVQEFHSIVEELVFLSSQH